MDNEEYYKGRYTLPSGHPLIGKGYRILGPEEILISIDETACVSTLMSAQHFQDWHSVIPGWSPFLGLKVKEILHPSLDIDGKERLFRRIA